MQVRGIYWLKHFSLLYSGEESGIHKRCQSSGSSQATASFTLFKLYMWKMFTAAHDSGGNLQKAMVFLNTSQQIFKLLWSVNVMMSTKNDMEQTSWKGILLTFSCAWYWLDSTQFYSFSIRSGVSNTSSGSRLS